MRKALLMLTLALVVTTLTWSQSLAQQLIEISNDLNRISETFESELETLETQLLSLRQASKEHSTQLDDLGPRVASSEESLADLRSSHTDYRTYVQTALNSQATEIRSLKREIWIYRVGIGAAVVYVGYRATRAVIERARDSRAPP